MWTSCVHYGEGPFMVSIPPSSSASFHFWIAWLGRGFIAGVSGVTNGLLQGIVF